MRGKVSGARLLAGAAVAAAAAALFVAGNDRDDSLAFFLAWLLLHVLYGCAVGSFWVLAVVLAAPPLLVALAGSNGEDTPLWLQAASVELFYGVPFAFLGVLGRRLWQARRPPVLPGADAREGRRP